MQETEKYLAISDDDVSVIEAFLSRSEGGEFPNFETLDGFLTALIIGPDFVSPSQFMPIIAATGDNKKGIIFDNEEDFKAFFGILIRHWNHINATFMNGDAYMLYLAEDDQGNVKGNDWAIGFLRGTELHRGTWIELLKNDDLAGPLMPIFALKYENDADPGLRPYKGPMTQEQRENLITMMIVGVKKLYDLFQEEGDLSENSEQMPTSSGGKVGRNDPCPCGSGKKFKKCCALKTFH